MDNNGLKKDMWKNLNLSFVLSIAVFPTSNFKIKLFIIIFRKNSFLNHFEEYYIDTEKKMPNFQIDFAIAILDHWIGYQVLITPLKQGTDP